MKIGDLMTIIGSINEFQKDIDRLEKDPLIKSASKEANEKRELLAVRKQAVEILKGMSIL